MEKVMLTVIADALRTATRQEKWDAPQHWKAHRRSPMTDREARKIEETRKSLQFRSLW